MPHDHDHEHSHDHSHDDHAPIQAAEPAGPYHNLADAARELLIEKGYFTQGDMREMIERIDSRTPAIGAKVVAKAWTDPAFKERLLANGKQTLKEEMDIDVVVADLVVVENTEDVHNIIVCTLCSCYPVFVLGRPPDWYKSREYRSRVVREPRAVLREFGTEISDDREVRVHDSTADMRYLVLPKRPDGTDGWSEEQLAGIVGRDSMVGTTEVQVAN